MQTLNFDQVEQVNGGVLPVVIAGAGLCILMISNADKIGDFIGGFLDGVTAK